MYSYCLHIASRHRQIDLNRPNLNQCIGGVRVPGVTQNLQPEVSGLLQEVLGLGFLLIIENPRCSTWKEMNMRFWKHSL